MKIAMLAPIWEQVPPPAYGGIELIVSLLTEGLVARGHEVTLFATGNSVTRARLSATEPRPLRELALPGQHSRPREETHLVACFEQAAAFDLLHNHLGTTGLAFGRFVDTPVLTTLHGPFDDHNRPLFERCAGLPFVSISDAQRRGGPALDYRATVYNGIETARFGLQEKHGYLLHLGRVSPEKGTHVAAAVARRTGRSLVIAGKVDPVDRAYFEQAVKPLIDGRRIRFVGEVGGQAKADMLAGADALLHPVQWPEPFGLVMAEAMASGTPVIAFPQGSIPEVVEHGLTGFVVENPDAMCDAVGAIHRLSPEACRRRAVERFDAARMVDAYVEVYAGLLPATVEITADAPTRPSKLR